MNFEIHGSKSVNYDNIVSQDLKPEKKAPLDQLEFTYKEARKPSDTSTSIIGPTVRLVATFLTLGISEDIHKKVKKTIVANLSKALTYNGRSKEDRQNSMDGFKKSDHYGSATRLSVQVGEKTKLDGMIIKPLLVGESEKYVIWLNGIGADYEGKLADACVYADTVSANILVFNYRGNGDSTTNGPTKPKDLVTDTLAMITLLTERGVKPEDIVIHGYSLGGGVGALAAQETPGTSHINDRSYSSFSKAIKEFVSLKLKEKIGQTAANTLGSLVASLIKGYDLDLNTRKIYKAGIKDTLILHHPDDKMIRKSSLKNFLTKHEITSESTEKSNHKIVNLSGVRDETVVNAHNTFFKEFQGTAKHVAEFIHNKSFASIYSSSEENADLSAYQFPDYENLDIDLSSFANFVHISDATTNSEGFDIEGLGSEEVLNLKPKSRNSEEI